MSGLKKFINYKFQKRKGTISLIKNILFSQNPFNKRVLYTRVNLPFTRVNLPYTRVNLPHTRANLPYTRVNLP